MAVSRETEGLLASLKTLTLTLVDIVQTRLELLSVDVAEERARLTTILISAMVALFCLAVGVVLLTMFIVVLFWDSHRLVTLGLLTAVFLGGGAALWGTAIKKLRNKPRLFDASISELAKDRDQLTGS